MNRPVFQSRDRKEAIPPGFQSCDRKGSTPPGFQKRLINRSLTVAAQFDNRSLTVAAQFDLTYLVWGGVRLAITRLATGNRPRIRYTPGVSNSNPRQFAMELARVAHDHKSEDIIALDLTGIGAVMDYTVIATGSSQRQIRALGDAVVTYGKKVGEIPFGFCGYDNAAWVIVDYVNVVFHVFAPSYRQYYDLELLWGDVPKLEWPRSETA